MTLHKKSAAKFCAKTHNAMAPTSTPREIGLYVSVMPRRNQQNLKVQLPDTVKMHRASHLGDLP
jgi:hypothetical protein